MDQLAIFDKAGAATPEAVRGRALGELGAQRAADRADAAAPSWSAVALEYLKTYAMQHGDFQAIDVRRWAEARGFPKAPDSRAWGAVVLKAKRDRLIAFVGYEPARDEKQHGCPTTVWRRVIDAAR